MVMSEIGRIFCTPCTLSIVAAVRRHDTGVRWLERVRPQIQGVHAEIVLVGPGVDPSWAIPGDVLVEAAEPSTLTPRLWSQGITASRGRAIALTVADCLPAANWVAAIMAGLERAPDAAAIGGVIDLDPASGPADWALYFLRYSGYMPRPGLAHVDEIAADNAVYLRSALDRCSHLWRDGFWEPPIHACLRRAGLDILLDSHIVVRHGHSLTALEFSRQRLIHGRMYGATRVAGAHAVNRAVRVVLAPAALALMLGRVTRRVFQARQHRLRFLASLPILVWFTACWIVGEAVGYAAGLSAHSGADLADLRPRTWKTE